MLDVPFDLLVKVGLSGVMIFSRWLTQSLYKVMPFGKFLEVHEV